MLHEYITKAISHSMIKRLIGVLLSLNAPGTIYIQTNRFWTAVAVLVVSILWLCFFAFSRNIITPHGFYLLNAGLLALHLISWVHGAFLSFQKSQSSVTHKTLKTAVKVGGWLILSWGIAIFIHTNKSELLGFNLYHIPSRSMQPALNIGDIVLSDTWFTANDIQQGSVVIFKRSERGITLIKRITQIRKDSKGHSEIFVEGDNSGYSVDSRRFGWVDADNIIGLATSKIFSVNKKIFKQHQYPRKL